MDAATASIAGGLFEYVFSLKVASRDKKDAVDEGRYSEAAGKECGVDDRNLSGRALRVLVAVRARMAARCGVFDRSADFVVGSELKRGACAT